MEILGWVIIYTVGGILLIGLPGFFAYLILKEYWYKGDKLFSPPFYFGLIVAWFIYMIFEVIEKFDMFIRV